MAIKRPSSFEEHLAPPPRAQGQEFDRANTFLDCSPNEDGTPRQVRFRLVGLYVPYAEHNPRVWDKNAKSLDAQGKPRNGGWVGKPFPDAAENTRGSRICTQDDPAYGECPWCKLRYQVSYKFAINVIERVLGPNNEVTSQVRVLSKGKNIIDQIMSFQKNQLDGEGEPEWVQYGGEIAPEFLFTINKIGEKKQDVRYSILERPRSTKKITAEEIELLKSVRTITEEEKEDFYAVNPDWKKYPEWYIYGHNLDRLYAPTLLRAPSTSTDDMALPPSDSDDPMAGLGTVNTETLKSMEAGKGRKAAAAVAAPTPPPPSLDDDTPGTIMGEDELF